MLLREVKHTHSSTASTTTLCCRGRSLLLPFLPPPPCSTTRLYPLSLSLYPHLCVASSHTHACALPLLCVFGCVAASVAVAVTPLTSEGLNLFLQTVLFAVVSLFVFWCFVAAKSSSCKTQPRLLWQAYALLFNHSCIPVDDDDWGACTALCTARCDITAAPSAPLPAPWRSSGNVTQC